MHRIISQRENSASAAMLSIVATMTVVLAGALSAEAAYISEVFLDDGRGDAGVPNAVELTGIDRLSADAVDLVVIDAGAYRLGSIRQIITIPALSPLTLVSERDWPSVLWGSDLAMGGDHVTLKQLGAGECFSFATASSLILFDRPTLLQKGPGQNIFSSESQAALDGAELIDAVTLTEAMDATHAEAPGDVYQIGPGHALVRPLAGDGSLSSAFVAGEIADMGALAGTEPPLPLTPGKLNPLWNPVPEPTSAVMMLGALAVLLAAGGGRGGREVGHRRRGALFDRSVSSMI